jgi:signal recognition particle subunit SRP54
MTRAERRNPEILNANRRRRIAAGSGTDVTQVNQVLKQFRDAQRIMKTLKKTGNRGLPGLFRSLK